MRADRTKQKTREFKEGNSDRKQLKKGKSRKESTKMKRQGN